MASIGLVDVITHSAEIREIKVRNSRNKFNEFMLNVYKVVFKLVCFINYSSFRFIYYS